MKKFLAIVLALCMVCSLCAVSASADDTIKLKMHFVDPETAPYVQGGLKIAELVKEATDGKIEIEVLAGGSLGKLVALGTMLATYTGNGTVAGGGNSLTYNYGIWTGICFSITLMSRPAPLTGPVISSSSLAMSSAPCLLWFVK